MFFKNLTFYRLPENWSMTAGSLEEKLATRPLIDPPGAAYTSAGWIPAGPSGEIAYGVEKNLLIALGFKKRLLPSSVVKEAVAQRAKDLQKSQGFAPGRKQLRDLKDRVISELLPKSHIQTTSVRAWLDTKNGIIGIDSSTPKRAEELVSQLRATLNEEFPVVPFESKLPPSLAMTMWLQSGDAPRGFTFEQETELVGEDLSKPTVKYVRHDVVGKQDVQDHIKAGKRVIKLALAWGDSLFFTLTDKLQLKKIAYPVKEDAEAKKSAPDEVFEGEFTLMTGLLSGCIRDLNTAVEVQP